MMSENNRLQRDEAHARQGHPDLNLLSVFTEGALRGVERLSVLSHLADCEECRRVALLVQMTSSRSACLGGRNHGVVEGLVRVTQWPTAVVAASLLCGLVLLLSLWDRDHMPVWAPAPSADLAVSVKSAVDSASVQEYSAQPGTTHVYKQGTHVLAQRSTPSGGSEFVTSRRATGTKRISLAYTQLVALPEPLPSLPDARPLPSLSLTSDVRPMVQMYDAAIMFGATGLETEYAQLASLRSISLKPVPIRTSRSACNSLEPSIESSGHCTALYNKQGFMYLAQSKPLPNEINFESGALSVDASLRSQHSMRARRH